LKEATLNKIVRLTFWAVILAVIGVVGYYYYDRYQKSHGFENRVATLAQVQKTIDPKNPDAWVQEGIVLMDKGQVDEAIKSFKEALRLNETHKVGMFFYGYAHHLRGNLRRAKNDEEGAEKDFQEAFKYYERVINYYGEEKLAGADRYVEYAYFWSGVLLYDHWRYGEALGRFKKALKINPSSSDTYLYIGKTFYKQEEYKEALENLNLALKFDPAYPDAYYWRGLVYEAQGETQLAIEDFQSALHFFKERPNEILEEEAKKALARVERSKD
jgi:tetratricopeptide (TPR) repeat protein